MAPTSWHVIAVGFASVGVGALSAFFTEHTPLAGGPSYMELFGFIGLALIFAGQAIRRNEARIARLEGLWRDRTEAGGPAA